MTSRVLLALAACSLFYAAVAVEYFPNGKRDSVIITSQDLTTESRQIDIDTSKYYIYGTYSTNTDTAPDVSITDGGNSYTVGALHNTGKDTAGKLDYKVLEKNSGKLTVTRNKKNGNNTDYFTLYVTKKADVEVYSASLAKGNTVKEQGDFLQAGVVVISAEKAFTLSNLKMGSSATLELHTAPNEVIGANDDSSKIFYVQNKEYGPNSFAIIAAPVTTLFMAKVDVAPTITFTLQVAADYNSKFTRGCVFSVTSAGYKNQGNWYNNYEYDRKGVPINQTYTGNSQSLLNSYGQGIVQNGDTMTVTLGSGSAQSKSLAGTFDQGKTSMAQQKTDVVYITGNITTTNGGPNYYVMITSGSSLLNSLAALVVAACLALTQ